MADFRRYQPRHARSGLAGGRRWLVIVIGLVGVVVAVQAMRGGEPNSNTNTNSADSGIQLLNQNENTNQSASADNTNTAQTSNTNSGVTLEAPDASNVDLEVCPSAISQYGTRKVVALTFNVAAANQEATALINQLSTEKIAASFFVSGAFAEKNPELIRQLAMKGFGVYNRSYDNPKFSSLTAEQVTSQLSQADAAISELTERTTKPFFRPPFGDTNETSITAAREAGYCTLLWTVDALDWQSNATADQARQRVVEKAKPGAIIMLSAGYDVTAEATKLIAADLRKAGYTLVSLVELVSP